MKPELRRALIGGYRRAGQARGVVHAIGQLPRAQGHTLMRDLIVGKKKQIDREALAEVLYWLRDAGLEMRRMRGIVRPPRPDMDSAVVDFFEDGHGLLPASEMIAGELPYRDITPGHGLLTDGLIDLASLKIRGETIGKV
ncbi:MAG: hypothetical protein H7Z43_01985, partial [Clostridia bacterium]|nr:hypothetical protein [Deltaproteobacteria bacterium]